MNTAKGKCGAEASPQAGPERLDLEEVRERLTQKQGPELWRSLEELAETPAFQEMLHREFPRHASELELKDGVSRRHFLQLTSASLALAGLTGCTKQPVEKIIPYVRQPEQVVPGRPLFYATALSLSGYGMGVLAESHMGRPTKIEGNPDHPASLGATDVFSQAATLTLYDPQRSQSILNLGRIGTWSGFVNQASANVRAMAGAGGGLRILTGSVTSPTLTRQIRELQTALPGARWHRWEPAGSHQAHAAAQRAFGAPHDCRYDFSQARVVLTLNADPLATGPGAVRYSRDFSAARRVRGEQVEMNRLYAVESTPTPTASLADHRLQLPPAEVEAFALALARMLGVSAAADGLVTDPKVQSFLQAVAADLRQHSGASVVVADDYASPALQVVVHAINQALGNVGRTVLYMPPVESDPVDHVQSLAELVRDMNAGQVQMLVMFDGMNPVYTAPADIGFAQALQKVPLIIHHGLYLDETAGYAHWHIPAAHELESWSDVRAFDGTVSIIQPLIQPLYSGKTAHEVLAVLAGRLDATPYELVRETWARFDGGAGGTGGAAAGATAGAAGNTAGAGTAGTGASAATPTNAGTSAAGAGAGTTGTTGTGDAARQTAGTGATGTGGASGMAGTGAGAGTGPDAAWRRILHAGIVPNTQLAPVQPAVAGGAVQQAAGEILTAVQRTRGDANQVTLLFRPDPTIWDGRFFSNTWLQELPKPLSKLTWDNALYLSPNTAQRLKVTVQDVVELTWQGRKVEAAVWVQPGMADNTGMLTLGYGRVKAGIASGAGTNAYVLRTSDALWTAPAIGIRKLDKTYVLASTQNHHLLEPFTSEAEVAHAEAQARHLVRTGTLEQFRQNPDFIQEHREKPAPGETMYPNWEYEGHAWGMAIDQSVCTGCSSCVIACQAENNVPVVGKEQVLAGREMHWLRIDRYFEGSLDEPRYHHQPLPCMHCETAPCEVVCPVAATVHSHEGLNDMVYNRCVGTRYCSNNCPYKVRRFNFFRYSDKDTPVLAMLYNPDVTVRMRGVMEKCTYCVQRIEQAKIDSKVESQPIPPNALQTACQQACPTQAIVFGDINDETWEVTRWKQHPLNYGLLEELNTRPRTSYLAKLRNPNPALEPAAPAAATGEERTTDGHS